MKTNQIMKRDFNNNQISQRTSDGFFFATELLEIYNSQSQTQKRFKDFWENKNTQEFLKELEKDLENAYFLNNDNSALLKTHETTRGRYNGGTWLHPYLFVKFAMWLSPKFELQIIKWVYDNLIDFRNQAGDYYKEMCNAIQENYLELRGEKPNPFIFVEEANLLNLLTHGTKETKQRNLLSEKQLALLNNLQRINTKLIKQGLLFADRKKRLIDFAETTKLI